MKNILIKSSIILSLNTYLFAGGGGDILRSSTTIDQFEYQFNDAQTLAWDISMYIGYDTHKIYIYSDGEKENTTDPDTQNDFVYSRAIAPYWDIQAGIAYDTNPQDSNTWAEVALYGLAPYFFETRVTLLIDDTANIALRSDFSYKTLLTQKLILTSSLQVDAYTKDNLIMGLSSGLSDLTLGARLRYEFRREFAPYIGVEWSKNFATTLSTSYLVTGIRVWF